MRYACLILFSFSVFGTTIPQYDIAAVSDSFIALSNQGTLAAIFADELIVRNWQAGDVVILQTANRHLLPQMIDQVRGRIQAEPIFILFNQTKDQKAGVRLEQPPVVGAATFSLTAIDTQTRIMTLSDSSSWSFDPQDENTAHQWLIGDIVIIGKNSIPSAFDALINTDDRSIVYARQN